MPLPRGGKFFGKVGSFDEGCEFDAVVPDDTDLCLKNNLSIKQRIQRDIYLEADGKCTVSKFVRGKKTL